MEAPAGEPRLGDAERRIYQALRAGGPLPLHEVAGRSGIETPRAQQLLSDLGRRGLVRASLGRPTLYEAVEPELARGEPPPLEPGGSYVVREPRPTHSFELLRSLTDRGIPGLCITRIRPPRVKKDYGFNGEVFWLSREADAAKDIEYMRLDHILRTIREFIEARPESAILLDGLEYLASRYEFNQVLRFIHDLTEVVALHHAILLIPIDPRAMEPRHLALLERDAEVITPPQAPGN